jgi:glutathione S-transferase
MLEEADATYDLTVISRDQKNEAWYRALHPLGRSPVVVDDDGPLFESAAICLQLADTNPKAGLIAPVGSHDRALQYQWCLFAMCEVESNAIEIARQLWSDSGGDGTLIARGRERLAPAIRLLDDVLGSRQYLVADQFSVADLVLGAVLLFVRMNDITPLTSALDAYCDLLDARPARQRALAVAAP